MEWPILIKQGAETAIARHPRLKQADIFDRAERATDPDPENESVQVFMKAGALNPNSQRDGSRFLIVSVEFTLAFKEPEGLGDDEQQDTVATMKAEYDAALYTILFTTMPPYSNAIDDAIYQVDNVSRQLEDVTVAPEIQANKERTKLHRIRQVWHFFVADDIGDRTFILTEQSEFLLTENTDNREYLIDG